MKRRVDKSEYTLLTAMESLGNLAEPNVVSSTLEIQCAPGDESEETGSEGEQRAYVETVAEASSVKVKCQDRRMKFCEDGRWKERKVSGGGLGANAVDKS